MDEDERAYWVGWILNMAAFPFIFVFQHCESESMLSSTAIVAVVGSSGSLQHLAEEILPPDCDFEIEYCRQISTIEVQRKLIVQVDAWSQRGV